MSRIPHPILATTRGVLLAGVTALVLLGCAGARSTMPQPDYSGMSGRQAQATVSDLSNRYRANPRDKSTAIHFSSALRAAGQHSQAVTVMEQALGAHRNDPDVNLAYAKALAAEGRFEQALGVLDNTIDPALPDWNALSVLGAVLDQMGRHDHARQVYQQALLIAPGEASLHANLGLSYAMTSDLRSAEAHLRQAAALPRANSRVRQNLALVVGLNGRFDEARTLYSAELPADQVEANMAYIRALLTQQNRWDAIRNDG